MAKQHQKHSKLARPQGGQWGRNEFALIGAPCGVLRRFAGELAGALSPMRVAWVDADHQAATDPRVAALELCDHIGHYSLSGGAMPAWPQSRIALAGAQGVLVNGNHFRAAHSIAVVDPRKALHLKPERIIDVQALVLGEGVEELPEELFSVLPQALSLPLFRIGEPAALAAWIAAQWSAPPLRTLLLAGGHSLRMGRDKAFLDYHGQPHWRRLAAMLRNLSLPVSISCRAEQAPNFDDGEWPLIPDSFLDLGPYGALLSAFRADPDSAWLVLACDLPFMNENTLAQLIAARDPLQMATAYISPQDGLPEPLIAIWEPAAYMHLLQLLGLGYSCPRKALLNAPVKLIAAQAPEALSNINDPEAYAGALRKISG